MSTDGTALLLIDLQTGLLTGSSAVSGAESLVIRLRDLAEQARRRGVLVVHVQDDDVGDVGSPDWEVDPRLDPRQSDLRLRKAACDAFHETELDDLLRSHGIQHLVIAGCTTELCIDTTSRRAVTLGYNVTLVENGHSTSDGDELSAASVIAHHHKILDGFGAYVQGRPCEVRLRAAEKIDFEAPPPTVEGP